MKTVQLSDVVKYENSDKWLAQEVSGRLLITSITFLSFDKEFIKVSEMKKTRLAQMLHEQQTTAKFFI